ncbi:hypothetical protein K8Z61_15215 [Nocardioides sp. TRM66260-LWL]|uniref:hypothetical protein n=1 Tax=Nocardioides sp. TRM66260-LWL TaxID=2874478 RepID=UPI001CC45A37|nr:hypothetical protein [Nocardioides sp. TRM66260-LWL]MBZ5735842.1 hypothetical protein [Nocardioides sp. TRM66260-LWL]
MGASDRFLFQAIDPKPVWIDLRGSLGHGPVYLGVLVEWRQRERPGRPAEWEGLVAWASGGGELPWSLAMRWIPATELRPVDLRMPADLAAPPRTPPDPRRNLPGRAAGRMAGGSGRPGTTRPSGGRA